MAQKYVKSYDERDTYDFSDMTPNVDGENSKKARKIYSTAIINKMIEDRNNGYDIDYEPFYQKDLDLRAPNITFLMTDEEYEEYQKCYDDALYYVEHYCKFLTDNGLLLVELRDYQQKVIKTVTDEVYLDDLDLFGPKNRSVIWLASRQVGKTTTVSAFISWMLIFHANRNILVVANKEATSIEIVDKITNIFKGLPYFLKPGCTNFGKTGLRLENGSRILSSATTNTASIGFTIHCVLLDEFAHIPDNIVSNFWRSVYPTLSSSKVSQCIITSTPNGTTNKFYELWSNAIEKHNSFIPIRTDYWEVPDHDDEWAEAMKADFGEDEFAQEFELQFNINSRMLLKGQDLKWLSKFKKEYVHKDIYSDNPLLQDENITWHPDFDPNDISPYDKFIFLVDLAEGAEDGDNKSFKKKGEDPDFNTINIFKLRLNSISNIRKYANKSCSFKDAYRFIQVGKYSSRTEDETYCGQICAALAYDWLRDDITESVKVMVEVNFNGKSFLNAVSQHPLYYKGTILSTYHTKPIPGEVQRRRLGFKTKQDKENYCIKGAKQIGMKRIITTDEATLNQMQSFGFVKGKLKGIACHDDLSMPVFNHITRMLDEETFITWLEECLEKEEDKEQVFKINQMIEAWAMDNPETSDSEFNDMYGIDSNSPFDLVQNHNPYSSETSNNPYSTYSGTGIGYGQMYPGIQNMTYSSLMGNR